MTKKKKMTKTKSIREHPERVILEICDLGDIGHSFDN